MLYPGLYLAHVAGQAERRRRTATSPPSTRRARIATWTRSSRRRRACARRWRRRPSASRSARSTSASSTRSTRVQFGKPIGTYQAVSHPLAQTYTDVELARSLVYWAAWCVAEDDERAPLAAAAAKAFATEAAVAACERSIQVHGGIGFTWEHPLHRFYKRALWLEGFGRRPAELRARGRGRSSLAYDDE